MEGKTGGKSGGKKRETIEIKPFFQKIKACNLKWCGVY
jgi:hypothetical protein